MSVAELTALPQPHPLFSLANEYIWIQCPLKGYTDVWAEVRLDLTNGERRALKTRNDELARHRQAIEDRIAVKGKELDDRHAVAFAAKDADALAAINEELAQFAQERSEARLMGQAAVYELIAPYVRNWNIPAPGTTTVAPTPQAAGIAAFDAVNDVIGNWLFYAIITAYSGNGFRPTVETSSTTSAEPAEATKKSDETMPADELPDSNSDPIQPSPTNSRGRSRSGSTT